jgi:cation diffusion facilitator CzcD-associated flavoprotein CzcO
MSSIMGTPDIDVAVVGAGFAGLLALHRVRGLGLRVRAFEAAHGIGGTWYWNRYPGARCDVESLEYSYQFSPELQQEWEWTERYASQPEILRYLEQVAERFALRSDIQLGTRITAAHFDEHSRQWVLHTSTADRVTARWLIMATGCLSRPYKPPLAGLDKFRGELLHTGEWPHETVDFSGKRVGVIGTGSSGIQCIPLIAQQATDLFVFQRTPSYSVPAHNGPLDPQIQRRVKANYAAFRAHCSSQLAAINVDANSVSALAVDAKERRRIYDERWGRGGLPFTGAFADLRLSPQANATAAEYVRSKILEVLKDREVTRVLLPYHLIGCKRLCVDTDYYATFNRSNVTLVDARSDPIETITSTGLRTKQRKYELDSLVLATGFDAMTGALLAMDIRGHSGLKLKDAWHSGPSTYLGLATAHFPNMFLISGPGSPSVLSNMAVSIEQHVNWIVECIRYMEEHGVDALEAREDSQDAWVQHVNQVANGTLFPACDSWYLGANVPGKPRVFMPYVGGFPAYSATCAEVAAKGYPGFILGAGGN